MKRINSKWIFHRFCMTLLHSVHFEIRLIRHRRCTVSSMYTQKYSIAIRMKDKIIAQFSIAKNHRTKMRICLWFLASENRKIERIESFAWFNYRQMFDSFSCRNSKEMLFSCFSISSSFSCNLFVVCIKIITCSTHRMYIREWRLIFILSLINENLRRTYCCI